MVEMVSLQYDVFVAPLQVLLALMLLEKNPDLARHFTGIGSDAFGIEPMTVDCFSAGYVNLSVMAGGMFVLACITNFVLTLISRWQEMTMHSPHIDLAHVRYFVLSDSIFWCLVTRTLNLIALFALIFVPFGIDVSLNFSWIRHGNKFWQDHIG